jgi:RecA-family ATPase
VTHNNLPDLKTAARLLGGDLNGDQITAPGPGHSAADRSLSVRVDRDAPDGFIVHSFAPGDDPIACRDYVREKLKLPAFKPNGGKQRSEDDIVRAVMAAAMGQGRDSKPKGKIVETYNYTDADGALLYQVLRLEPKSFRQRRPDGNGGWIWKLEDQRVLYRLLDLKKFPDATVFVCEGEKDANRVASLDHCATTVAAGKWTDNCIEALADRDVIVLQDNDRAGAKKALIAAQALHSVAKTIRIVLLPDLPDGGDVSDWLDSDPRRADKFVDICFDAPLWTPNEAADAEAEQSATNTETDQGKAEADQADTESPLVPCNIAAWAEQTPPAREWAVRDRFPLRNVSLLNGEGAIGKSILLMQLGVAHALGKAWLNTLPEPGPFLYLNAEEEEDELWRRLDAIATFNDASLVELKDHLHLFSRAGQDAVLGCPNRSGLIRATPLLDKLKEAACDIKPKLIGLDTSADIFAGNENDRSQVRQFIGLLRGMAIAANSAVIVCAHPSITGIDRGTGMSGSTGWHNSARARAYMHAVKTEDGIEPDKDLRQIEFMKSNYGPIAETITVRWKAGVFVIEPKAGSLEKLASESKANDVFLQLLDRFTRQGRNVGERNGISYAPANFAKEEEAKMAGLRSEALADAMRRLFATNRIHIEDYGRPSRRYSRIVAGPAPAVPA